MTASLNKILSLRTRLRRIEPESGQRHPRTRAPERRRPKLPSTGSRSCGKQRLPSKVRTARDAHSRRLPRSPRWAAASGRQRAVRPTTSRRRRGMRAAVGSSSPA
jgi:hypothetical protein